MTIAQWVALRIQELCTQNNLSINKLATISCLTQSTVNSIMHGESKNPKLATIHKICTGLNITLSDFFRDFNVEEE